MYDVADFAQRIALLYPKTTPYRFVYRGDLPRAPFHGVKIYFLLHDDAVGYTYKGLNFWHQSYPKTPKRWATWIKTSGVQKLVDWWLPSHNAHYETERTLVKILCFHRQDKDRGRKFR